MYDATEFILDDGTTVAVEPSRRSGINAVGLSDRLQPAEKTLREALAPIMAAATQVMDGFRGQARRPEEIEVSFGVTLDAKLGGVIASANAGAHLDVTLRWRAPGFASDDGSPEDALTSRRDRQASD
jgi:hypothetical protein